MSDWERGEIHRDNNDGTYEIKFSGEPKLTDGSNRDGGASLEEARPAEASSVVVPNIPNSGERIKKLSIDESGKDKGHSSMGYCSSFLHMVFGG